MHLAVGAFKVLDVLALDEGDATRSVCALVEVGQVLYKPAFLSDFPFANVGSQPQEGNSGGRAEGAWHQKFVLHKAIPTTVRCALARAEV